MERRGYRLEGRVQGVGFRWWARMTAAELGLRGTVRNARDGAVEVDVEGESEILDRFEARLREGPVPARVDALHRTPAGSTPLPAGFEIVH